MRFGKTKFFRMILLYCYKLKLVFIVLYTETFQARGYTLAVYVYKELLM